MGGPSPRAARAPRRWAGLLVRPPLLREPGGQGGPSTRHPSWDLGPLAAAPLSANPGAGRAPGSGVSAVAPPCHARWQGPGPPEPRPARHARAGPAGRRGHPAIACGRLRGAQLQPRPPGTGVDGAARRGDRGHPAPGLAQERALTQWKQGCGSVGWRLLWGARWLPSDGAQGRPRGTGGPGDPLPAGSSLAKADALRAASTEQGAGRPQDPVPAGGRCQVPA